MWNLKRVTVLVIGIILIDQIVKIYVKTHFVLGESYEVFSWFKILFIENEGAAWGLKIPGVTGKIFLSIFRIIAVFFIGRWLLKLIKQNKSSLVIISVALIFSGAVGNIIDSLFYGIVFDDSHGEVATLFAENPYGKLLQGKVVDMFFFPIINTTFPDWFPFWGGNPFKVFQYIFNVSDAFITIGGISLLFYFRNEKKEMKKEEA